MSGVLPGTGREGAARRSNGEEAAGKGASCESCGRAPDEDGRDVPTSTAPGNGTASADTEPATDERDAAAAERARPRPSWAMVGIFLLLLVGGLAYARAFLTPVLLALLLALIFSPIRRTLCRIGLPVGASALAIVGGLGIAMLLAGALLVTPVMGWVSDAPEIGARLEERVRGIRTALLDGSDGRSVQEAVERVKEAASPGSGDRPSVILEDESLGERLMELVPTAVVQSVLVLVLLLFLLGSGDMFYEKIVHVTPRFRDKRRAMRIAHDIERKLSRYLLTITVINAGLGVSIGLAMWALGMPDPLLFAMVGFLFNYVPYVGAIAGSALVFAVGLLTFDGLWLAILPGMAYYFLTAIEGQFVTPYFIGRSLKLNTVVVFMTIAFWAWLWSVVGMLIAVPVLVAIRTICQAIPQLEPLADFLSARGAERDDEPSADGVKG